MKQSAERKGLLNRESVQVLNTEQLREVWGGYPTDIRAESSVSDSATNHSLLLDEKAHLLGK
jgi:hypothetical protein